ncbi:MAG TPA: hypothetical protein VFF52_15765, partial [Isosphaeraceae bacterium]|nr:hypothetical protein [Isosphaeraceae bacterium]
AIGLWDGLARAEPGRLAYTREIANAHNLAFVLHSNHKRMPEALRALQTSIALREHLAVYRAGRFDEAVRRGTESRAAVPADDPEPLGAFDQAVLAMAHHRLGQADAAARRLEAITRLDWEAVEGRTDPQDWWLRARRFPDVAARGHRDGQRRAGPRRPGTAPSPRPRPGATRPDRPGRGRIPGGRRGRAAALEAIEMRWARSTDCHLIVKPAAQTEFPEGIPVPDSP